MLDLASQILGASRLGQKANLLICRDRSRVFSDAGRSGLPARTRKGVWLSLSHRIGLTNTCLHRHRQMEVLPSCQHFE
jgi:hypothetical protein